VLARRKLWHYFEAHPVTVVSSFPLGEIIRNPNTAGKIAKWYVELMGDTLAYAPRKAISPRSLQTSSPSGRIRSCPCRRFRPSSGPSTSMGQ
jgi:hypothetical protein